MSYTKVAALTIAAVFLLAPAGVAQNLVPNPGIETANSGSDPNYVAADWRYSSLTANAVEVSRLAGGGVGASYSLHAAVTQQYLDAATDVSKGAWVAIPVEAGKKYQIHGKWRGNIMVESVTNSRAMAELYIQFSNSPTSLTGSTSGIIYKKRMQYGNVDCYNIDTLTGTWDWEDISASPEPAHKTPPSWWNGADTVTAQVPTGGTETPLYMVIRLSLLARYMDTMRPYVDLDNFVVTACQSPLAVDLNGDCAVGIQDLALFSNDWLKCGLNYPGMCW